jgi:hypothetical protein
MLRQDVIATSTSRAVDGFSMLETCSSTSGASNPESLRVARSCELGFLSSGVLSEVTRKPCPCGVTGSTLCMTAMPSRSIEPVYMFCNDFARELWRLVFDGVVRIGGTDYSDGWPSLFKAVPAMVNVLRDHHVGNSRCAIVFQRHGRTRVCVRRSKYPGCFLIITPI